MDRLPEDIHEALEILKKMMPEEEKERIRKDPWGMAEIDLHFGLGSWVRNAWYYSGKCPLGEELKRRGVQMGDNFSSLILTVLCRHLRGESLNFEKEVEKQRFPHWNKEGNED